MKFDIDNKKSSLKGKSNSWLSGKHSEVSANEKTSYFCFYAPLKNKIEAMTLPIYANDPKTTLKQLYVCRTICAKFH